MRNILGLVLLTTFVVIAAPMARGADVILNEYNAVSGSNTIGDEDSYFGVVEGNGGNWFELIVVNDHVDMRGWQLDWAELGEEVSPGVPAAGTITLSNADLWSDMRMGAILTFIETSDANGQAIDTSTDTSFDPLSGDWWINISTTEEQSRGGAGLTSTTTNDGADGEFSVGNDDWILTIKNSLGDIVFGPAGEGSSDWDGGGVSSSEGGSLEGPGLGATLADWQAITPASNLYDDTGGTSFGDYNQNFVRAGVFEAVQDPSALQAQVIPEPSAYVLASVLICTAAWLRWQR